MILRYGLAVLSVALALLPALLLQHHNFLNVVLALFLFAIAFTAWQAGVGPAALSIVLSMLCYDFFFLPPVYHFYFTVADVPAIVILVSFAVVIVRFSAHRRRIERQLLQARNELQRDIDERKQTEKKLRRSETYLAEAQRLSHTGSWAYSPVTGKILYWSDESYRIWGINPQTGPPDLDTVLQRIHPADHERVRPLLERGLEGRSTADASADHRIVLPDGTIKHLHGTSRPVFDETGKIVEYIGTALDVTERVHADEARQELEAQWKAAFENNPTMYFIIDEAGETASVNPFGAEQLGFAVSDLVGQPTLNLFYEPDRDAVQKHVRECFDRPGRTIRWAARKVRKDGTILWVRETANAVLLNGRLMLLVVCEDITEQKRAEDAARRSERELREAIENVPAMLFVALPGPSNVFVSRGWRQYTGLSSEQTAGAGWQSAVHPEDMERFLEKWRIASRTGEPFEDEARFRRAADGEYRWFLVRSVSLRDEHGNILKWYGVLTDIEDRKRAEEAARRSENELRNVIDTIPTMAWTILPDGRNNFANQSWLEYTGSSSEDASGAGWKASFHPADVLTHTAKWDASLATGKPFEDEVRIKRAGDGEYRWFLCRGVPLRDENGNILKWYGVSTDIEDRKRAEALLTGEKRILEMVAKGDSLAQILDSLCRLVEEQASEVLASVLLVDGNRLRHGGAPSLPKAYTDAIDGVLIGPAVGSCGTAAYRCEQVIVEDIAINPLWADYRAAALPHSLRACWSTPIFSSQGKVMATFAMYYREPRIPSPRDQAIIEQITNLAGVAIERQRTQEELRRSEAYLAETQRLTKTGSWATDPVSGKSTYWSGEMYRIYGLDAQLGPSNERFWQLVHPEDVERVRELANSKADVTIDHRILLPDGTMKHVVHIRHPVFDGAGKLVELIGSTVDVTEPKRAEEALRRSEAYLAEAQKLTHTGSFADDPNTLEPRHLSDEMVRMWGYEPEDGLPTRDELLDRLHPEDRDKVMELTDRCRLDKTEVEDEFRIVLPDGRLTFIHRIVHAVLNATGEVVELIGTNVDVTERKQSEEALRRSEAYLAEAQRLTRTATLVWDADQARTIHCSDEIYRMFGLDPQKGMPTIAQLLERVHPEDCERVTGDSRRGEGDKVGRVVDYRVKLPDGTVKYIHSIRHPILNDAGDLTEFLGSLIDVTEQKRAEEELHSAETRFRTYVDHATDGLFVRDVEGRVIEMNRRACESLGYTREELIGQRLGYFDRGVDETRVHVIERQLDAGELVEFESTHRRKDGIQFPVEVRIRPFWQGGNRFSLCLVRDISERKSAEQERERLRHMEEELAHMNRVSMMGELAGSLAHEIKQPITAAATNTKTGLRWLQREPPALAEAREAMARSVKDVIRAAEIIDRNRSLYSRNAPQKVKVNLNELIREMIVLLHDVASRHAVSIHVELERALPAITADRVQIQQVLMNLMLNGIEAMGGTGGELTITSKRGEDHQVLLSVSDLGIGLAAEDADRIFDAFFTTKAQGTGVGLSISRRIIESHGGRLWAAANEGRGATFYFNLPGES